MCASTEDVDSELHHSRMLGENVPGAVGLGDDRGVGANARAQKVSRSGATLKLPYDAGHDQLAFLRKPGSLRRGRGRDHRGDAGLHVPDAGSEEHVSLGRGLKRIAGEAVRKRVDVDVAVQHQALAASRPAKPRDALEPSRVHFLELGLESQLLEMAVEEPGAVAFLGGEARDPAERARDLEQFLPIDLDRGGGIL